MPDIDRIAGVLREYGITETAQALHDERFGAGNKCRAGTCTCFADLLADLEKALTPASKDATPPEPTPGNSTAPHAKNKEDAA